MSDIWSWNQIDVYVSLFDNILGDASVDSQYWVPLSNYGLLRGRVALKPSTVEGNSESIPGRDGKPYSVYSSRGNATLSFELLIADTWIPDHKQLNMTIRQRMDTIEAYLNRARRIAYKQPGKDAESYFEVYKVKITEQDAYEEAGTVKAEIEVHPFEFYFSGNIPITIPANQNVSFNIGIPFGTCMPYYVIPGGSGSIHVSTFTGSFTGTNVPADTIVDSYHGLVYDSASGMVNRNAYFDGSFDILHLKEGTTGTITNTFEQAVDMYSRKGITR